MPGACGQLGLVPIMREATLADVAVHAARF